MDIVDLLRLFRTGWLWIVSTMLVTTSIGLCIILLEPATYSASAQLYFTIASSRNVSDLAAQTGVGQQLVKSYARLATTPYVLDPVISNLALNTSAAALANDVTASVPQDTVFLQITATDASAEEARAVASGVAAQTAIAAKALAPNAGNAPSIVNVTLVQEPTPVPLRVIDPSLVLLVAALTGALVGLGLAALSPRLARKPKTAGLRSSAGPAVSV